jgi:predicted DsbA family dithiol-disulfide isomerase
MLIDVWSDIACPWCWIGKRRLERGLSLSGRANDVAITWRAFELDPTAPPIRDNQQTYVERLARKYGTSVAEAQAMIDRMTQVGEEEGVTFRFDRIRPGNTFDAHRLLHLARAHALQDALAERLLAAYFSEGHAIGDRGVLLDLAEDVGLAANEVRRVLASDAYGDEVRGDEARAQSLGVTGVPFFVFAGRFGVSGAQPPELLARAIEEAWVSAPANDIHATVGDGGDRCDPAGCD